MGPRSDVFPWIHLDMFSLSFYCLLFQARMPSTDLVHVWNFGKLQRGPSEIA